MKLETILSIVSQVVAIPSDIITSKSRKLHLIIARNIYYNLARDYTRCSLNDIGKMVNRNHATVLHGIFRINQDLETNYLHCSDMLSECIILLESKETTAFRDISILILKETNLINILKNKIYAKTCRLYNFKSKR